MPRLATTGGPNPGGPNPAAAPLFAPPGRDLTGQEALDSIKGYIANSRFTDCAAGWPTCAVEQRYLFCPNGLDAAYLRLTSSSGSDIISYGQIQPLGADQKADGSFAFTITFLLNGKAGDRSRRLLLLHMERRHERGGHGPVLAARYRPAQRRPGQRVDHRAPVRARAGPRREVLSRRPAPRADPGAGARTPPRRDLE